MSFAHFYHENNSSLEQPFSANGRRMVGGRKRNTKIILPKGLDGTARTLKAKDFYYTEYRAGCVEKIMKQKSKPKV